MADIDIAELERMVERATPGDWFVQQEAIAGMVGITARPSRRFVTYAMDATSDENIANAALIAAAPAAIRSLIERVKELRGLLDDAPIMSKYHGHRGFEDSRFISDYEAWRVKCRAALKPGATGGEKMK